MDFPLNSDCQIAPVRAPLEHGITAAILEVGCYDDFGVIFLKRQTEHSWQCENSISFLGGKTFGNLETHLANVSSAETKDIIIERLVDTHGTGYLEEYYLVLKVIDRRLRVVLDTMEHFVRVGWPGVQDVDERSVFKTESPSHGEPGDIREDETLTLNDERAARVSERYLTWDDSLKIFIPGGWLPVAVAKPKKHPSIF
ncbi:MAG: hypothetical protein ACRD4H_05535, partial [Candidatus Acidiferrales bacterium]